MILVWPKVCSPLAVLAEGTASAEMLITDGLMSAAKGASRSFVYPVGAGDCVPPNPPLLGACPPLSPWGIGRYPRAGGPPA
ncbi:MAG: hypothetical protein JXX28_18320 [Deltaproteobacteria bacterium]|nr:hypothetical protein [Deltaproteobacteria bacterium]